MIRRPPRSTLFPTRRSSDLAIATPGVAQQSAPRTERRSRSSRRTSPAKLLASRLRYTNPRKDRKSTRLNSSHTVISYAVFCLKKKKKKHRLITKNIQKKKNK